MKTFITVLICAGLLTGCDTEDVHARIADAQGGLANRSAQLVTLDTYDIECVIVTFGTRKGGISCNWEDYNRRNPQTYNEPRISTSCADNPRLCAPPAMQHVAIYDDALPKYCLRDYKLSRTTIQQRHCIELYIEEMKGNN